MQRLYQAHDRIEAQFVRDHLASHRIESVVLGDFLAGAAGELPLDIYPTVWVLEDEDLPRAQELLRRFLGDAPPDEGLPWRCPCCGEAVEATFEICWNCGAPRP